jgi:hypothetical protein
MLRALVQGSSLGESSLCFSQSSRSLVSRSDWEMRSKANAPVKRWSMFPLLAAICIEFYLLARLILHNTLLSVVFALILVS